MRRLNLLAVALLAALTSAVSAEGWGTIKGRFVIPGGKPPPPVVLAVPVPACLANGPITKEEFIVSKDGGVRNVVVWIATEKDGIADHKTMPDIHPALVKIKDKEVVVDQPCCKFEPHVVVMRKGQDFVGKNSSQLAHAIAIQGDNGVNLSLALAAKASIPVPAGMWKPHYYPSSLSCGIHPWMQAKLFVIGHPYFAISDEDGKFEIKNVPAGKLRIIMWHEGMGWVHKREEGKKGYNGQAITVEAGKTLDVGQFTVTK